MANADLPRGFRPYGRIYHVGIYVAGGTIYKFDAVKFETGASNVTQKRARVVAGTAGAALCGVALHYAVAGDIIRVYDDPAQLFLAQADGAEFDANEDLGLNAPILATAGNATYKMSRMEIDSSDLDTTATDELKIVGLLSRQDGKSEFGGFAELIVKINNHQLGSGTGTAGV